MIEARLRQGLAALEQEHPAVRASALQVERLLAFLDLLVKWNEVYNLTAIRQRERMVTHHLLDSIVVLPHLSGDDDARTLLDVGSGAGLPGIPVAIMRPRWRIALNDANAKKCTFLQQARIDLEINNVAVLPGRVEAITPAYSFDYAISRGFADLAEFATLAGRHVKPDGRLFALKGVYPDEELAQLPSQWQVRAVHQMRVPGLDAQRCLVEMSAAS